MISKLCAAWLVLLALSPFTAPFATCDLAHPIRGIGGNSPFGPQLAATRAENNAAIVPARAVAVRPKLVEGFAFLGGRDSRSFVKASFSDAIGPLQRQQAFPTNLRV